MAWGVGRLGAEDGVGFVDQGDVAVFGLLERDVEAFEEVLVDLAVEEAARRDQRGINLAAEIVGLDHQLGGFDVFLGLGIHGLVCWVRD